MNFSTAAIMGAGSLGTSLAKLLAPKLEAITLVSVEQDVVAGINSTHRNPKYLTDVELPAHVTATTDTAVALDQPLVIFAVPTSAIRPVAEQLANLGLPATTPLLSCAKGIERNTGERMSEILREVFPQNPIGILTGPNHAEEIAKDLVTCAVVASENQPLAVALQQLFTLPHFRTYTTRDVAGIELGGAVKNVYALAAGMAHGLGLGDNAVAALVTRALAEMIRIGTALGGEKETFVGLSGVGDLIVTCFSEHSRNHRVGHAIGTGKTLKEAVDTLGMVAEGVPNTLSIYEAARKANVRTPILDCVYSILYQDKPAPTAMRELLSRDPRPENG
ncbi:MAG: NAD(P)H-dependent glycerol-3-phosphate dehydrogenase [Verrucomicrobiales bacterium]|nr:NAD(P)H-dependent glycerol-3-phosphate dehydrogenase [Verrucomicrobiota bacterium JB025]